MSDQPALLQAGETWLVEQWLERFANVLEAMVDEQPSLTWTTEGTEDLGAQPLIVGQKLGSAADPLLWIGVPEETWRDIGGRVLMAAGVESVSDEESRNTCLEILEQSIGALAQSLTERLDREVVRSGLIQPPVFPEGLPVVRVTVQYGNGSLPPLWISFAPLLNQWLSEEKIAEKSAGETPISAGEHKPDTSEPVAVLSKTFDLLLDVALPVSVSFGRTELAIKEVLKLTTGSIVELDRSVNEPVEVIVNNCVIARGEVVVVDGNYGVRIIQIASRQERLRTGSSAGAANRTPRGHPGGANQTTAAP